jgi:hypothetical protein
MTGPKYLAMVATLACAAVTNAATVEFFDDFATGLTPAVTRSVTGDLKTSSTIVSTTPFGAGSGEYLHTRTEAGTSRSVGVSIVNYTNNSVWNTLVGTPVLNGGISYLKLNGGFDILVRPNSQDRSSETATGSGVYNVDRGYFRFADIDGRVGATGLRINYSGLSNGLLTLQLSSNAANSFGTSAGIFSTNSSALIFSVVNTLMPDEQTVHLGFTLSTDDTTGQVTYKMWGVQGTGSIDTTTSTVGSGGLLAMGTFYANATAIGQAFSTTSPEWWKYSPQELFYHNTNFIPPDGSATIRPIDVDYDNVRLQSGVVTEFTGVPVPEPTSMAILGLSVLGLAGRRRNA